MRQRSVQPKKPDTTMREVPPNAGKTMAALREMGYDSLSSISDIVDNSIDAGATKIWVTVREAGKQLVIDILDDGIGMDEPTLAQALRLGSDTEHKEGDLGKFGMGLVTASISMAKCVTVISRKKGGAGYEANFNLDTIAHHNKFVIHLGPAKSETVLKTVGQNGTLVTLSQIDRISDTNVARFVAKLRAKIGQTYRHFIDAGITFLVNNRKVVKIDPLMLTHELTEVVLDTDLDLGHGVKAHLKVVELPELGQSGDAAANIYPHNSGFYVTRNRREIMEGQTFGFYRHHHSYSHFRAELAFDGKLDGLFHVDVKKQTIQPGQQLLEKLQAKTARLIAESGKRGRSYDPDKLVKLKHSQAEDLLNTRLMAQPAAATAPVADKPNVVDPKSLSPKAKGKKKEENVEAPTTPAPAVTPAVQFQAGNHGTDGAFYVAGKVGPTLRISYNTEHPFYGQLVKAKQAGPAVDLLVYALATAEQQLGTEGRKVKDRVCDILNELLKGVSNAA